MSGTSEYKISFTVWTGKKRIISLPIFKQCVGFGHAYERAQDIKQGMQAAQPEWNFQIASIECTSYMVRPVTDSPLNPNDIFALGDCVGDDE